MRSIWMLYGRRTAVMCCAAILCGTPALAAQGTVARPDSSARGTVVGTVHDPSGAPVPGATVEVAPSFHTETDANGAFVLHGLPTGVINIQVRHLGFAELLTQWELGADTLSVALRMHENPTQLPTVQVEASRAPYQLRLDGFYQRMKAGTGHYLTRADLDRYPGRTLPELLSAFPGVSRYQLPTGGEGIRIAGQNCLPLVVVDGFPATALNSLDLPFNLDTFDPVSLEGVEYYRSGATVPAALMGAYGMGSCGMIAVWSRPMRPNVRANQLPPEGAVNIDSLLRAKAVYGMGTVDVPASYLTGSARPVYPDSLYRARVSGQVLARFVVDTSGRVERGSAEIVSSTHKDFANSVLAALPRARFTPAVVGGRAVRAVVEMPFKFMPPGASADSTVLGDTDSGSG